MGVQHIVDNDLCYWIITDKGTVLARTTVQHVTRDEVTNYDCQRCVTQLNEKLDIRLGQRNNYAVELNGYNYFINDNVPNPFGGKEQTYIGPENEYVNNATYSEAADVSYDTYIRVVFNLTN